MNSTTSFDFTSLSMNCSMLIFASFCGTAPGPSSAPLNPTLSHICTPNRWTTKVKWEGAAMRAARSAHLSQGRPWADGTNIITRGGFFPETEPLSRTGCSWGTRLPDQRSLPEPETPVTKPASAAATLAAPCPSLFSDSGSPAQDLAEAFLAVRNETERRAAPLTSEDQLIQSMPDASPAKWHRAHTTWFFEQFLLGEHGKGYTPFHPDYAFLFNSYYVSAGPRHARHQRGHPTRPGADEVTAYRRHVDAAVVKFLHEADEDTLKAIAPLLEVGLNHEQQHQELM